jgi:hypothetical protein
MFPKLFAPGKIGSRGGPRLIVVETDSLESLDIAVHYAGNIGEPRKFFKAIEERTPTALRIV